MVVASQVVLPLAAWNPLWCDNCCSYYWKKGQMMRYHSPWSRLIENMFIMTNFTIIVPSLRATMNDIWAKGSSFTRDEMDGCRLHQVSSFWPIRFQITGGEKIKIWYVNAKKCFVCDMHLVQWTEQFRMRHRITSSNMYLYFPVSSEATLALITVFTVHFHLAVRIPAKCLHMVPVWSSLWYWFKPALSVL